MTSDDKLRAQKTLDNTPAARDDVDEPDFGLVPSGLPGDLDQPLEPGVAAACSRFVTTLLALDPSATDETLYRLTEPIEEPTHSGAVARSAARTREVRRQLLLSIRAYANDPTGSRDRRSVSDRRVHLMRAIGRLVAGHPYDDEEAHVLQRWSWGVFTRELEAIDAERLHVLDERAIYEATYAATDDDSIGLPRMAAKLGLQLDLFGDRGRYLNDASDPAAHKRAVSAATRAFEQARSAVRTQRRPR